MNNEMLNCINKYSNTKLFRFISMDFR